MNNVFSIPFLLSGAFFILVAALGVWRFPDFYSRVHAASKAATLGLGLMLIALIIEQPSFFLAVKALAILIFIFLTAPVAAHLLTRVAHQHGEPTWDATIADELKEHRESGKLEGKTD
ncbi:MAG: monovalent cation/H(+) antiporter subunit G [Verrucomicrobiales bacterium]